MRTAARPAATRAEAERLAARQARRRQFVAAMITGRLEAMEIEDLRILEIGTTNGVVATQIASALKRSHVTGIDPSPPLIDMAREAMAEGNLADRLAFEISGAENLPYEDNAFDLVLSLGALRYVADVAGALREIERVLSPRGRFMVSEAVRSWRAVLRPALRFSPTQREMRRAWAESGIRDCSFTVRGGIFVVMTNIRAPMGGPPGMAGGRGGAGGIRPGGGRPGG
jgi:ubiquinone/menaquinone biosynthesis C-methylase UbiE